ncbi:MAG: hypothetical protein IJP92_06035 [Lachnospiraceae bacterium]|nr:hypothetical protein [Lachnospiraceae bacterium]
MTEKELRKLSRVELLKLLVEVTEENEMLRAQLQGQQELVQRAQIQDSQEVRESVEDVFRTVESTATGFLSKAQGIADQIMEDARVRAESIIRDAEAQAGRYTETPHQSTAWTASPQGEAGEVQSLPLEGKVPAQPADEAAPPPYEPFTAAAPQMQQVIEEIALEQSPQQSAENAFETDALFEGTNATEVTEKRLTEVRVTIPEPLAEEPEEEQEDTSPVPFGDTLPSRGGQDQSLPLEGAHRPGDGGSAPTEVERRKVPAKSADEVEEIAEPETYGATDTQPPGMPIVRQVYPEREELSASPAPEQYGMQETAVQPAAETQTAPAPEDSFRIEGLEDTAPPQEKPLTAIDMLKRMQGGGS